MPHRCTRHRPFGAFASGKSRFILAALLLMAPAASRAGEEVAQEYAVKAAFLVNFAQFVDWPPEMLQTGKRITIGVIGRDPFGATLDSIVSSKNATAARYEIRRYPRVEDMETCHILFVTLRDEKSIRELIGSLHDRPTLTVGETDAFAKCGGMINFFVENDRVCFEINQTSAEKANLKISAKLLRLQKKASR